MHINYLQNNSLLCRRMFPSLQVTLSSLEPSAMYAVLLEFQSTHGHRWRFLNGEWQPGNSAVDAPDQRSVHVHQNSPATGAKWMQENITFTKFKLSNKENGNGKVGLFVLHQTAAEGVDVILSVKPQ